MHFALSVLVLLSAHIHAKGLDGTKWKVKSHKLTGEDPSWTNEEAAEVTGKMVSFTKEKFKLGEKSCKMTITPQRNGRNWTAGEKDPCTSEDLKGRVYSLSYDNCEARFPGFVALTEKNAVAFGDGVSFCLEKK